MIKIKLMLYIVVVMMFVSCAGTTNPPKQSQGHITKSKISNVDVLSTSNIPELVASSPYVPLPKPHKKPETYTVVVNEVPVRELLFAIGRDANIDIDIVGQIEGTVTLNAIDKTLMQILDRVALHTNIQYQLKNNHLIIKKDQAYLKSYHVDYVNMSRKSESKIELATQIAAAGISNNKNLSDTANNSFSSVSNESNNMFWETIENNIRQIVNVNDSVEQKVTIQENKKTTVVEDSKSEKVFVNKETGLITVFATDKKHKEIQSFLNMVLNKARQQVLVEATIIEVALSDEHKSGVDWSIINTSGSGLSMSQNFSVNNLASAPFFSATFSDPLNALGNVTATVKLLEQFGDVQVLSSPKIIAMNNQTAILKVVDNRVYFTTSVEVEVATSTTPRVETFSSELHTVPVGFVMNVTPSIGENKEIILNVRPTISRILGVVQDPNPSLSAAGVISNIPEIQVREMESMLRMNSGQVAIIGGLMQDKIDKSSSGIPGLDSIPYIGGVFGYKEDKVYKTELLVFIKSTIVNAASVDNELKDFYKYIPTDKRSHLSPSEIGK